MALTPKWKARSEETLERHKSILAKKNFRTMLFGDSIFERMIRLGYFLPNTFNAGVGGDGIEHMMWRVENGAFDNTINLERVIIMAGANNTERCTVDQMFNGFCNLVQMIANIKPGIEITILAIPFRISVMDKRGNHSDTLTSQVNSKILDYNTRLKIFANSTRLTNYTSGFEDITSELFDPQFYCDHIHFNENGYAAFYSCLKNI